MKVAFNYQDIRDALNIYAHSARDTGDWRWASVKLNEIMHCASHYRVRRRADAAHLALTAIHLFGPRYYSNDEKLRQRIREIAAIGR